MKQSSIEKQTAQLRVLLEKYSKRVEELANEFLKISKLLDDTKTKKFQLEDALNALEGKSQAKDVVHAASLQGAIQIPRPQQALLNPANLPPAEPGFMWREVNGEWVLIRSNMTDNEFVGDPTIEFTLPTVEDFDESGPF